MSNAYKPKIIIYWIEYCLTIAWQQSLGKEELEIENRVRSVSVEVLVSAIEGE